MALDSGYFEVSATMTNADRIRAMTDEELAEWVSISKFCKEFCGNEGACSPDICKERFRDWLQQPCGGANHAD